MKRIKTKLLLFSRAIFLKIVAALGRHHLGFLKRSELKTRSTPLATLLFPIFSHQDDDQISRTKQNLIARPKIRLP